LESGEPSLDASFPELAKRPYYETNRLPGQLGAEWGDEIAAYYDALLRLGRTLVEALARSLGGSLSARIACFERPSSLSTLRFNHYSSKAGPAATDAHDGAALGCEAHVDSGLLTLLYQDGQGGLQVQGPEGSWVDVPPDPNSLVVNTGLAFETLSNGRFRATRHRVLHSGG
jgi:isopenicillin N synthase-like dioxygenase